MVGRVDYSVSVEIGDRAARDATSALSRVSGSFGAPNIVRLRKIPVVVRADAQLSAEVVIHVTCHDRRSPAQQSAGDLAKQLLVRLALNRGEDQEKPSRFNS